MIYCSRILHRLKQEETLENANDRMLKDIELMDRVLKESPELGIEDRLPELAEKFRQRRDEEQALKEALLAPYEGDPDDDLIERILKRVKREENQKN